MRIRPLAVVTGLLTWTKRSILDQFPAVNVKDPRESCRRDNKGGGWSRRVSLLSSLEQAHGGAVVVVACDVTLRAERVGSRDVGVDWEKQEDEKPARSERRSQSTTARKQQRNEPSPAPFVLHIRRAEKQVNPSATVPPEQPDASPPRSPGS